MKLANKIKGKFVIFVSEKPELKDMGTGEQEAFDNIDDLIEVLKGRVSY